MPAVQKIIFIFPFSGGGLGNQNPARTIAHSPPGVKETLNYWLREKVVCSWGKILYAWEAVLYAQGGILHALGAHVEQSCAWGASPACPSSCFVYPWICGAIICAQRENLCSVNNSACLRSHPAFQGTFLYASENIGRLLVKFLLRQ